MTLSLFAVCLLMALVLGTLLAGFRPRQMIKAVVTVMLMFLMGFPAFGWGGDGFLLPGRGKRVAMRCADGTCAIPNAPRRRAAVAKMASSGYGCQGSTSYGYSSGYGSAGQTSYSSQQQPLGYTLDGEPIYEATSQSAGECDCDCENCTKKSKSTNTVDEFKDALTEVDKTERDIFREELMLVSAPVEEGEVLLASK